MNVKCVIVMMFILAAMLLMAFSASARVCVYTAAGSSCDTPAAAAAGPVSYIVKFSAAALSPDGTFCAAATDVQIDGAGSPRTPTIICADNDGSTLDGSWTMVDWDGGPVTLTIEYVQTAVNTGAFHGDVVAMCRAYAEDTGAMPTCPGANCVAMDDAAVTGSGATDAIISADLTPQGSCATDRVLWFRWLMNAAGTTTPAATLNIKEIALAYQSN